MPAPGTSGVVATALAAVLRRDLDSPVAGDVQALAGAVEAVMDIHRPSRLTVGGYVCAKCLDAFPCTTVRALEHHLRTVDA
jgi:hypothetical protein